MVRKIKNLTPNKPVENPITGKTLLGLLDEMNSVETMKYFLNDIKDYEKDELLGMELDGLLALLPQAIKNKVLGIISSTILGGRNNKYTEKQVAVILSKNYDIVKEFIVDFIMKLKEETPESIEAEKELNAALTKTEEASKEIQEIQYALCKTLRLERLAYTQKVADDIRQPKEVRERMAKYVKMIKAIDDYSIITDRLDNKSKTMIAAMNVPFDKDADGNKIAEITNGDNLHALVSGVMVNYLNFLIARPEYFPDCRGYIPTVYKKLFNSDPSKMKTILYFWLGYFNAILDRDIGTLLRAFVVETGNNISFLAKDEMPQEDMDNLRAVIELQAANVEKHITELRAASIC